MSSTSGCHSHYAISFVALLYHFRDSHSLLRLAWFFFWFVRFGFSVCRSRLLRCLIFNMILLKGPVLRQAALVSCLTGLVLVRSTTRYPIEGRHQGGVWGYLDNIR
jgi:hypothetical protein